MAVPYNTSWFRRDVFPVDPDSFPEAMYVQMPDRAPGQPVLLPVVRMGCDTALVVIPPAKGRCATMVSATPVKATPLQSRPSTTSMSILCSTSKTMAVWLIGVETATVVATAAATSASLQHEAGQILPLRLHGQFALVERVSAEHQGGLHGLGIRELYIGSPTPNTPFTASTPSALPALW